MGAYSSYLYAPRIHLDLKGLTHMKLLFASLVLAAIALAQAPPPCPPLCPNKGGGGDEQGGRAKKKQTKQQKSVLDNQKKTVK